MRYIALVLLIANIGYFIWGYTRPKQQDPQASEPRQLLNNGLMLVSEFEAQAAALALENAGDPTICSIVSGFATVDDANGFILVAKGQNLGTLLNLTGELLPSQFRVYLPPEANRILATRALDSVSAAIAAAELEIETYLITRGPLAEGVGLGVFRSAEDAELVRIQVSELGFAPEIEEISRSNGEIQVVLRPLNSNQLDTAEWLEISDDRPDLTRTENLCETIAQASQFP
ncbi:MAG: hypothetical protein OXU66_09755 [Gammaproteobacteria bacterium]|nr:hypothetical protein [Gammaproteobacteria bacterium]MDD9897178.1 hypothetical protein [Gammaproteobacteria bacterium]MDD9959217.1 hypothetical protein [Gammaproteobacteria bacterium]